MTSIESALPANNDAERAILGTILLDNTALQQATELTPDDFLLDAHRRIFRRMRALTAIDSLTLCEELERHGELETVGGHAYISSLFDGLPDRPSIGHYVKIVREKSLLRGLIHAANAATIRAEQGDSATEILADLIGKVTLLDSRATSNGSELNVTSLDKIEAKRIVWLWPEIIPSGKLSVFAGDPDLGKSLVSLDVATRATTGRSWPDGKPNASGPISVLALIAEDGVADTVKPRLLAAGADLSRIASVEDSGDGGDGEIFELDKDLTKLDRYLASHPEIKLVI